MTVASLAIVITVLAAVLYGQWFQAVFTAFVIIAGWGALRPITRKRSSQSPHSRGL